MLDEWDCVFFQPVYIKHVDYWARKGMFKTIWKFSIHDQLHLFFFLLAFAKTTRVQRKKQNVVKDGVPWLSRLRKETEPQITTATTDVGCIQFEMAISETSATVSACSTSAHYNHTFPEEIKCFCARRASQITEPDNNRSDVPQSTGRISWGQLREKLLSVSTPARRGRV